MIPITKNNGSAGIYTGKCYKSVLIDANTGSVIASDVFIAKNFWQRLRGLQFKREVPPGHAFILPRCNSIHTCFMRFKLDVVFVDDNWAVLNVFRGVKPFVFIRPQRGAYAAIEMKAGQLNICPGHRLQVATKKFQGHFGVRL